MTTHRAEQITRKQAIRLAGTRESRTGPMRGPLAGGRGTKVIQEKGSRTCP
jgi:hypothetical protein